MSCDEIRRPSLWVEIGVLVAILAVAAFFRLLQLDTVPPGMTHDEAAFGAEAEIILGGERPIYFALGYGHEPLYAYLVALAFSLLGHTMIAIRVTSAICGLLVVLGTYLVARRMFGTYAAWIGAAWMAVAFWPVSLSRQALRAVTLPMLWLPAAWMVWRVTSLALGRDALQSCELQVAGSMRNSPATRNSPERRAAPRAWTRGSRDPALGVGQLTTWAFAGLFLGATLYTYMASRVTWFVYPLFGLYLLLQDRTRAALRRIWPGVLVMLVVAGLVAMPLFLYLRAHPADEQRVDRMMEPIRELLQGKPGRVLRHAWNAVRVFSFVGDRFWAYNIPGRPVFNWVGSVLFYAGLGMSLWRWRDPRYAFLVIWLAVGMGPALVTSNEGIFLRAIVAQPVTYLLVAEGVRVAYSVLRVACCVLRVPYCALSHAQRGISASLRRVPGSRFRVALHRALHQHSELSEGQEVRFAPMGCGLHERQQATEYGIRSTHYVSRLALPLCIVFCTGLIAMEALRTYRAYFVEWPSQPEARNIYNYNLVATAQYLRDSADDSADDSAECSAVGISALYPLYYHDPWIVRYVAGRDDLQVRWFGGQVPYPASCVVYPATGDARYVFSALTPPDPALRPGFESQATLVERRLLAPDDQNPHFEVWHWQGSEALSEQVEALRAVSPMWVSPEIQFTQPDLRQALAGPAQFGDTMALTAYHFSATRFQPGDTVELVTYWQALRTVDAEDDWVTFVHLLDANSQVVGGVDVLHCPPTGWFPGDVAVQVHRFTIAENTPAEQEVYPEIGVYRRSTGRLQAVVDGRPVGDRVLLAPAAIGQ